MKLDKQLVARLCCPACKSRLAPSSETAFQCGNASCRAAFPIVDGVPILIDESRSVFRIGDFQQRKITYRAFGGSQEEATEPGRRRFRRWINRLLPSLGRNVKAARNLGVFGGLLCQANARPVVLVIGGGVFGAGLASLPSSSVQLVETDVSFGPRTALICDGHDIPFLDQTFDGVIVQAVLEHVVDPYRCVSEIHRVLKSNGLVYAETPFMQQVHGGRYDFVRFTHRGHRRLFHQFTEIESGAVCGPGMALAWSYKFFLRSFAVSARAAWLLEIFARLTSFWLLYFDRWLIDKPRTLAAASAYYFMGRKSEQVLSDKELIRLY